MPHHRRPSAPTPILSRLSRREILRRYERLAVECDRLGSRLTVAQHEIRRLGMVSGRNVTRMARAEDRATLAESALAAARHPGDLARLLLECERMIYRLAYPTCPACRSVPPPHERDCALAALLRSIQSLIPV